MFAKLLHTTVGCFMPIEPELIAERYIINAEAMDDVQIIRNASVEELVDLYKAYLGKYNAYMSGSDTAISIQEEPNQPRTPEEIIKMLHDTFVRQCKPEQFTPKAKQYSKCLREILQGYRQPSTANEESKSRKLVEDFILLAKIYINSVGIGSENNSSATIRQNLSHESQAQLIHGLGEMARVALGGFSTFIKIPAIRDFLLRNKTDSLIQDAYKTMLKCEFSAKY